MAKKLAVVLKVLTQDQFLDIPIKSKIYLLFLIQIKVFKEKDNNHLVKVWKGLGPGQSNILSILIFIQYNIYNLL